MKLWDCYRAFKEESLGVCERPCLRLVGKEVKTYGRWLHAGLTHWIFLLETESDCLVLSSLELTEMRLPLPTVLG